MSAEGKWGKRRVNINNKAYFPYLYQNGAFKRAAGYIFVNPKYFITNDGSTYLVTSDNKYFKVFDNTDILAGFAPEGSVAIAGEAIAGYAIV